MLINRLLKRDEIEGFTAVAAAAPRQLSKHHNRRNERIQ